MSANPRWQRRDAGSRVRIFADACGLDEDQRRELVPMLPRRARAMHEFLARQAKARVQPLAGMWDNGHGAAWQADADYIEAHQTAWAAVLFG